MLVIFGVGIDRRRFVKSIKQVEKVLLFLCLIGKSRRNLVEYSILYKPNPIFS